MGRVWEAIVRRAQTKARNAQTAVTDARRRLQHLEGRRVQLQTMCADYQLRMRSAVANTVSMSDYMTYRRFIEHVESLMERLSPAITGAQQALAAATRDMRTAEEELVRMEKLVERRSAETARLGRVREGRNVDAAAIAGFNRRKSNG